MKTFDVGIIGGGPAGASAAFYLAKAGLSVAVFEKSIFPRPHVGESLLPFCHDLFVEMGITERLNKRFVRKPGVTFMSSDGDQSSTYCFKHVIEGEKALSYHVIRADFDKILLDNAKDEGAVVHEGCKVIRTRFSEEEEFATVDTLQGQVAHKYQVKFLLDASGQDTFLGKKMRLKKPHPELDRVSFTNHWSGAKQIKGLETGNIQIVDTGGDKQGWMSLLLVGKDRLSIGLVLNNSYVRSQKKSFAHLGKDWIEAFYRSELNNSLHVKEVLSQATILQPMQVVGNYSYKNESKYTKHYAMIGDAGEFLDPIFATGVYLAMKSGKMVANTIAREGLDDRQALMLGLGMAFSKIEGAYGIVYKFIQIFYAQAGYNFAQLGSALYPDFEQRGRAFRMQHFLLAGDFFDNHDRYLKFLEKLEDPRRYEQYRHLVMQKKVSDDLTCGYHPEEIYGAISNEGFVAP